MLNSIKLLFNLSLFMALYPYIIYPLILWAASFTRNIKSTEIKPDIKLTAAIIIAAHNEESLIKSKLTKTIEATSRIASIKRIVIVSDHSEDNTVEIAKSFPSVTVLDNVGQRGRASAHNFAVSKCSEEILIFTDVETDVAEVTYSGLIEAFNDPNVGAANPRIVYVDSNNNLMASSSGFYWKFEMKLREMETDLGLYCTGSGPCQAIRKVCFKPLPISGDIDFTSPLDVASQGKKCVHRNDLFAYDKIPDSDRAEYSTRIRMVAKNFTGTLSALNDILPKYPHIAFSAISHKVIRWLTPIFMGLLLISNACLLFEGQTVWRYIFVLQSTFYILAFIGLLLSRIGIRVPIITTIYSFVTVNLAFMNGILLALRNKVPAYYVPTRKLK